MPRAHARIPAPAPRDLLRRLCARIEAHGLTPLPERGGVAYRAEGLAVRISMGEGELFLTLVAEDGERLSWLQAQAEEHAQAASGAAIILPWENGEAPRPRHTLTFTAVRDVLPGLRRFTFLMDREPECAGDHLRIAPPGGGMRYYTIRARRGREIDVDVVMHGVASFSGWAARPAIGDVLQAMGPGGGLAPPGGAMLLAADMSALPALALILEDNPEATGRCIVAAPRGVESYLPAHPGFAVTRIEPGADLAAAVIGAPAPEGLAAAWFAGEAGDARAAKRHFAMRLGLPAAQRRSAAYWRREAA